MLHRKSIVAPLALVAVVCAAGTAYAASESASIQGVPPSQFQINPKTCRFTHREIDIVVPAPGSTIASLSLAATMNDRADKYEDKRHDIKMSCTLAIAKAHRGLRGLRGIPGAPGSPGPRGARGPAGPAGSGGALSGYVQVTATGTGPSVTAQCPAGDVVLGGGSPSETAGSWPSSTSSWTVGRDRLSPATLTVIAACAMGGTLP